MAVDILDEHYPESSSYYPTVPSVREEATEENDAHDGDELGDSFGD